jgi:penicillin-binding protein 1A
VLTQLPEIQGAVVSLEPATGAVQALVGGYDFALNQYNHALQAARQPGSGFKPFVYAAALANGITPASVFMDAPLVFDDRNLESEYRPDNDNNRYNGPTRLREALYRSINLVSMRVLLEVGARDVVNFVERFGFDTRRFPQNTQLAVGGGTMAVTPMDMAVAYATFANGGHRIEPHIVDRVLDIDGTPVFRAVHPEVCGDCGGPTPMDTPLIAATGGALPAAPADTPPDPATPAPKLAELPGADDLPPVGAIRVLDGRIAYVMHTMLQDVIRRGTGRRARAMERSDLAGKTGTTNDAADTWFNGYNPELVTTVWVGFPNHQPLGAREYGSNVPLPMWMDYMKVALEDVPEKAPAQPAGVVTMKIEAGTGEVARAGDPDAIFEYFLAEHAPRAKRQPNVNGTDSDSEDITPVDIF